MTDIQLAQIAANLATLVALSAPLMLAVLGETITERVGVINLSLAGTMMIGAMAGFAVAYNASPWLAGMGIAGDTLPVLIGCLASGLIGAGAALLIAWGSARLGQDQVAIGFVLTLLLGDMANFLGQSYTHLTGPTIAHMPIPLLKDIPLIGPALFGQDLMVYIVLVGAVFVWWWVYRTQAGLQMRGVGENPESAFARGVNVSRVRYLYTAIGGAMVGISGAAYTLDIQRGWIDNRIAGVGWIALAIVIFGGWHPLRGAFGALLYGATQTIANLLQQQFPEVPVVLFNSFQWLLMLGVLLLVGSKELKRLVDIAPKPLQRPLARALRVAPPLGLGKVFVEE
jgi:general nucleoside transport system permease protein